MKTGIEKLTALLRPTEIGPDHYQGLGSDHDGAENTYGGHFLGQASAVAMQSVEEDRHIHSLHAYFIRGGTPGSPIDYHVDRIRDGRSFSTRRVSAKQNDKILFELMASLGKQESSPSIAAQLPQGFADFPAPESLPPYQELLMSQDPLPLPEDWVMRDIGLDIRVVNAPWSPNGVGERKTVRSWFRANEPVENDPHLHASILAYQTDESLADILLIPFNKTWCSEGTFCVSLDHALWFHEPIDVNHWHFIDQKTLVARNGRGVGNGYVWSQDGKLVASFTQEVLFRI
ncbi:MAG: acyl-CoA thioesterase [Gammaproteobacteria bacterium]